MKIALTELVTMCLEPQSQKLHDPFAPFAPFCGILKLWPCFVIQCFHTRLILCTFILIFVQIHSQHGGGTTTPGGSTRRGGFRLGKPAFSTSRSALLTRDPADSRDPALSSTENSDNRGMHQQKSADFAEPANSFVLNTAQLVEPLENYLTVVLDEF